MIAGIDEPVRSFRDTIAPWAISRYVGFPDFLRTLGAVAAGDFFSAALGVLLAGVLITEAELGLSLGGIVLANRVCRAIGMNFNAEVAFAELALSTHCKVSALGVLALAPDLLFLCPVTAFFKHACCCARDFAFLFFSSFSFSRFTVHLILLSRIMSGGIDGVVDPWISS